MFTYCYVGDGAHCIFCRRRAPLFRIRSVVSPGSEVRRTIGRGVIAMACGRCVLRLRARLAREERHKGPGLDRWIRARTSRSAIASHNS